MSLRKGFEPTFKKNWIICELERTILLTYISSAEMAVMTNGFANF